MVMVASVKCRTQKLCIFSSQVSYTLSKSNKKILLETLGDLKTQAPTDACIRVPFAALCICWRCRRILNSAFSLD